MRRRHAHALENIAYLVKMKRNFASSGATRIVLGMGRKTLAIL